MNEPTRLKAFFAGAMVGTPILLGSLIIATVAPTIAPGLQYLFGTDTSSPKFYALAAIAISAILSLSPLVLFRSARQRPVTYFTALALVSVPAISVLGVGHELAKKAAGIAIL